MTDVYVVTRTSRPHLAGEVGVAFGDERMEHPETKPATDVENAPPAPLIR